MTDRLTSDRPSTDRGVQEGCYDLVIIGGTAGGLSVAISSQRSGIEEVRIVEPGSTVAFPELVPENRLDIGYGERALSVAVVDPSERGTDPDHDLLVTTDHHAYRARGVLVAQRETDPGWVPPIPVPESERVHVGRLPDHVADQDILIIGTSDNAVELVAQAAHQGGGVVLAGGGMDPGLLSPAGEHMLRRLERERRATVLYRSVPDQIGEQGGYPLAYFNDRRTPDLEFDHVVFATTRRRPDVVHQVVSPEALATGRVVFLGLPDEDPSIPTAPGWEVGNVVAEKVFPEREVPPPRPKLSQRASHAGAIDELREEHYNATITTFEPTHSDLWVLRVRPDHGDTSHLPGQYASLGLGFWEERVDDAVDLGLDDRWTKLIRRSYSISHPIFDEHGYLARQVESDELEFYIVLVQPTPDNVPALTPRLARKRPGDRIYLGPKVAGRYTLASVTDPGSTVVFLSTGTGEAPHNAMITELFHKGHMGPIVSAVTVRRWADLGYLDKHRELERRYPNYRYLPLPTRESDVPKRYLQDLITDGDLADAVGGQFEPSRTHVFLCGNPAMIGLPEAVEGPDGTKTERFPVTTGVVELLSDRGFTLDRRGEPGNIHYEEYW
ncbi:MAG: ferredoxin--NADP reductase [Actinomycetota bacterium]